MKRPIAIAAAALIGGLGCGRTPVAPSQGETWRWDLPPGYPEPWVPEDNPMTTAKVELGRHLFYDVRLSADQTMSCSTCHLQALAFTDGRPLPSGAHGDTLPRNAITLTNSAYSSTLTWINPLLSDIEQQVLVPMFGDDPPELDMSGREDEILDRFARDPLYEDLFADAFPDAPDPVSVLSIQRALACYVRSLVSARSPYDRWRFEGDDSALSPAAKRGRALFYSEKTRCYRCHGGFNFTEATRDADGGAPPSPYHNTGLYDVDGRGGYPPRNQGLFEFTNDPEDMGKFRPPTLRNVAVTAPYFHDGSARTLEEVIDVYAAGGRRIERGPERGDGRRNPFKSPLLEGFTLTDTERDDLVAFLHALTDPVFLTDPRHADPFD